MPPTFLDQGQKHTCLQITTLKKVVLLIFSIIKLLKIKMLKGNDHIIRV